MKKRLLVVLILISILAGLLSHLGYPKLRNEEPRRAIVAIESLESGDMLVPRLLGLDYYNKPPMFNWVLAGLIKIFNSPNEWVVRLPGIISLLLTGLFLYLFAQKYTNNETALLSALAYITSADIIFYASVFTGEIDLFYVLIVFLQIALFIHFHIIEKYLFMFICSYFFAALGFLTKGFPSVAFQAITILAILIYYKQWRLLFGLKHLAGIVFFVAVTGAYFYRYSLQADQNSYIVSLLAEATQRTAADAGITAIVIQLIQFPIQIIKLIFPWSLLVIFLFRRRILKDIKENKLIVLSSLFVVSNVLIYWVSPETRSRYVYMFFPFILLILVFFYNKYRQILHNLNTWFERIFGFLIIVLALSFLAVPFVHNISNDVTYSLAKGIVFFGLIMLLFFYYMKFDRLRIYIFILAISVARIGLNFSVLPHLDSVNRNSGYAALTGKIVEVTGDNKLYWTGNPKFVTRNFSAAGIIFNEVTVMEPCSIPFQIPYYYAKLTNETMQFSELPVPGAYCLSDKAYAGLFEKTIYLEYTDRYLPAGMVLYKVE